MPKNQAEGYFLCGEKYLTLLSKLFSAKKNLTVKKSCGRGF